MAVKIRKASEIAAKGTLNMLVYGAPGVGKTTFCSTAPKPLIVDLESSSLSIADTDTPIAEAQNIEDVKEAIEIAISEGYKTICIDSMSRYADLLMEQILREDKKIKPQLQHWGEVISRIKKMIWVLQRQDINTIFVCHEKDIDKNGSLQKVPNLSSSLISDIPAILDIVGYLYVDGFDGKRLLGINPTAEYKAKQRVPMSARIVEDIAPNFEALRQRIYGVNKSGDATNANSVSQ